ncbi:hypothetical protein R3P38DRAFT_3073726 [Favolaschia claudopus]|uniref:Uncharacterized protein n=1 Tax=Favolaschia claudopus TaxID=2862362 RepID=A0AAV9ZYX2_9AGAR
MALTQSARLPGSGPSWDDEVVPALRKRLEGESRILSKRISTALSISSLEEAEPAYQPRPSVSSQNKPPRTPKSNGATTSPKQRARTYSQPKLSEFAATANKSRSPDSSARTQYADSKPTRIPKAARTLNGAGSNGYTSPPPPASLDLQRPSDASATFLAAPAKLLLKQPSQDTIHIPLRQTSGLLNEPPPFMPGPESTNSHDDHAPPRPSNDSEERPFEHWYRGEVSRNGGVGELKHGRRAEMLEIANYGHTLKQKQALRDAEATSVSQRRRKRSESTAALDSRRESLHLDDAHANNIARVLDEGPLTDVDAEMSDVEYYSQNLDISTSSAPLPDHQRYGSTTPTPQTPRATRIPSPRNITPTPPPAIQRGRSEPPSFPASSSASPASRQTPTSSSKRAATASPPAGSSSAKKPRAAATPKAKPKPQTKRAQTVDDKNRRSVAYYPSPGEDGEEDLADAIPTWTQPIKPQTGRWDDVVLPVVARKKGLDGLYEQADGSPKPKTQDDTPVEPAAGTFGWDHSKYRPPRDHNDISMDEFGRPVDNTIPPEEEERLAFGHGRPLYPPTEHERQPVGPRQLAPAQQNHNRSSAPPFSDYTVGPRDALTEVDLEAQKQQQQMPPHDDEEGGAGCCKCVVM